MRAPLREWVAVAAIVGLLGAPLRLLWLDTYPPGLFYDPAVEAVDGQRILDGERPAFLTTNNGREPLFHYLMAGTFAVTGPTVWGLRLTSALIGLTSIVAGYVWARAWFGSATAMLAMALMAGSLWHVFVSRFAPRGVLIPLLEPLLVVSVWTASRSGSARCWLASGVIAGLAVYTYAPIRLFPIVVAAIILGVAATRWRLLAAGDSQSSIRQLAVGGAVMLLTTAVVAAPILAFWVNNPQWLNYRVGQVSLLTGPVSWWVVLESTVRTLGMFVWRGDEYPFVNLPGRPVFDWIIAPFLVVGLVIAVRRVKQLEYWLLLLWLIVGMMPGALSVAAPNGLRTIGVMPAVYVLPALGLSAAAAWLGRVWARSAGVVVGAAPQLGLRWGVPATLILLSSGLASRAYFHDLLLVPNLWDWYETDVATFGRYARDLPPDTRVYALLPSLPEPAKIDHDHSTLTFLAQRRVRAFESSWFPIADPAAGPVAYLITDPTSVPWRLSFPSATEIWIRDETSERLLLALYPRQELSPPVPRAVLARWLNGLELIDATAVPADVGQLGLLMQWSPLQTEVSAHIVVSILDSTGREFDLPRLTSNWMVCPTYLCGDVTSMARVVYYTIPRAAQASFAVRVRVLAQNGSVLGAADAAGRRIGSPVPLPLGRP